MRVLSVAVALVAVLTFFVCAADAKTVRPPTRRRKTSAPSPAPTPMPVLPEYEYEVSNVTVAPSPQPTPEPTSRPTRTTTRKVCTALCRKRTWSPKKCPRPAPEEYASCVCYMKRLKSGKRVCVPVVA